MHIWSVMLMNSSFVKRYEVITVLIFMEGIGKQGREYPLSSQNFQWIGVYSYEDEKEV